MATDAQCGLLGCETWGSGNIVPPSAGEGNDGNGNNGGNGVTPVIPEYLTFVNNSNGNGCSPYDLNCQLEPKNNQIKAEPPPSTARLIVGTVGGGILLIAGIAVLAIGIGLFPEDPPAGAFIGGAGAVLAALSIEVIYYTWRPLLPASWPKHIFLNAP
jgi:hypothetical protein